jgi:hypothetical protein
MDGFGAKSDIVNIKSLSIIIGNVMVPAIEGPAMSSKAEPSQFDAYSKAEADEPSFTLLARDPIAPSLIEAWAYLRSGQIGAAEIAFKQASDAATHISPQMPGEAQIRSAFEVADECRAWTRAKLVSGRR